MSSQVDGVHDEVRVGAVDAAGTVPVDDDWRRWIVENLLLDIRMENLIGTMISKGIARRDAAHEVDLALQSPYLKGVEHLRGRLRKRDWLLASYRKLNRLRQGSGEIDRRHRLSREEFFTQYYFENRPVIITGMIDDWPALRKWGLDYFAATLGDREVEVQADRSSGDNYEMERNKFVSKFRLAEFVERIRSGGVTNDIYITANNTAHNSEAIPELWDDIGPIPEYLEASDRRAGFLWIGPPGTITPFHHDLTNNLMAQVVGRKQVKVVPSWDLPLMHNHVHVYSSIDGRTAAFSPRPGLHEPQVLECILQPAELLFLPIGCMHFVEALDVSATVSFTNFLYDNDFSSFYNTPPGM
jgi:hypothetical protein